MTGPVAWIRFCGDGCVEGPILDSVVEEVQRKSGAWTPLYAAPHPAPAIDLELFRDAIEVSAAIARLAGEDAVGSKMTRMLALIDGQGSSCALPAASAKALHEAVAAIYFNDSSDYLSALWQVVRILDPSVAHLLERDESAAYDQTASALKPTKGEGVAGGR